MNLSPLFNFIIVEPEVQQLKTTAAGLVLSSAPEKIARGIVRAVGQGYRMTNGEFAPSPVRVGDRIGYGSLNPQFATPLIQDGKNLLLMRDSDAFFVDMEPVKQ